METHKPYGPYEKYFKRPIDVLCGILTVAEHFQKKRLLIRWCIAAEMD